jgi:hypothetical protein
MDDLANEMAKAMQEEHIKLYGPSYVIPGVGWGAPSTMAQNGPPIPDSRVLLAALKVCLPKLLAQVDLN